MTYEWHDIAGNIGVACIVLTYGLLQLKKMSVSGYPYSIFNLLGAGLIILSLSYDFNLSGFLMEAFWVLISLLGLILRFRERAAAAQA